MHNNLESSGGGRFWPGFRQESIGCLGRWLQTGSSGALVGLAGAGKSNLLNYISLYPEQVIPETAVSFVALVSIDLNHLIDKQPATLYRLILRACFHHRRRFSGPLAALIEQQYEAYKPTDDLFLAQTAVYDLMVAVEKEQGRLVLILDQFDRFCRAASPELTLALRGLRDSFKASLSYIVGMRQAAMYMPEPAVLGELYQLLDSHVCWVGAMQQADAQLFVVQEVGKVGLTISAAEMAQLLALTGGYAALIKAACAWWITVPERPSPTEWRTTLGQFPTLKSRLHDVWQGLTQEEQWAMAKLPLALPDAQAGLTTTEDILRRLALRGVCQKAAGEWQIRGELLNDYVQTAVQRGLGRIWQKSLTGELYQGGQRLEGLRPLEEALLAFFVQNPYKPHTKSDIIRQVWSDGTQIEGVTDDSLYQAIRGVREKIEPETAESPVYLLTKRGVHEGGYQFFPEGHPAN